MNKKTNVQENGLKAFIAGAAILILAGIWLAFVIWSADKTPVPAHSELPSGINASEITENNGGAAVARRIIVYSTGIAEEEGDTAAGGTDLSPVG
jgi:hypothetical protein